jgi:hypothetical protein
VSVHVFVGENVIICVSVVYLSCSCVCHDVCYVTMCVPPQHVCSLPHATGCGDVGVGKGGGLLPCETPDKQPTA